MLPSSHKVGLITLEITSALGRKIFAGVISGQHWEAAQEASAGTVSGSATLTPRMVTGHLQSTTSDPSANSLPLAYVWSNWVFSCRRCNGEKDDGWPEPGYVDPCADEVAERPREYLEYDVATGEIIPRVGLGGDNRLKAVRTINDLGLNKLDVRSNRFYHTQRFVSDLLTLPLSDRDDFVAFFTEGFVEYAGVTGMVVRQSPELLQQE